MFASNMSVCGKDCLNRHTMKYRLRPFATLPHLTLFRSFSFQQIHIFRHYDEDSVSKQRSIMNLTNTKEIYSKKPSLNIFILLLNHKKPNTLYNPLFWSSTRLKTCLSDYNHSSRTRTIYHGENLAQNFISALKFIKKTFTCVGASSSKQSGTLKFAFFGGIKRSYK